MVISILYYSRSSLVLRGGCENHLAVHERSESMLIAIFAARARAICSKSCEQSDPTVGTV